MAYITLAYFVLFACGSLLLWFMYLGGYFSAWFTSFVVAVITLATLSIPRRMIVDQEAITIACVLKVVEIPMNEIVSVRAANVRECCFSLPIMGSYGFFGIYGLFVNIGTFEQINIYASEWQNIVEIVDAYDDRHYISCRNQNQFIEQVESYISARTSQE